MRLVPKLRFSVSYTTRYPRGNERDGEDYFFISREEFEERIAGASSWSTPKSSATTTARTSASWSGPRRRATTWCSTSTYRVRDN